LRTVAVGHAEKSGPERDTGFDITAASEVMSILSLATDYEDLRARLGRIVVGFARDGRAVTAEELQVAGGMATLLRDAILPNLVQTDEGTPAIVHSGPFGNVALGNSSIVADRVALALADIVVTEAGFATELGAEKFFNVKCRVSGLAPDAAVVVTTVRALKANSGRFKLAVGKPLPPELEREDLASLEDGLPNLIKHIENVRAFGVPAVVAINSFPTDSPNEVARIVACARAAGARDAVVSEVYARGGEGGEALSRAVLSASESGSSYKPLYDLNTSASEKIETIATTLYGAAGVDYSDQARAAIERAERLGYGQLPICMAKTPLSLSGDPALKGRPSGFTLQIRDVRLYAGAGYLVPLAGEINLMPGLSKRPGGADIDLLADGTIVGLD
jgi:formyltetrahydrofolate synthetase